MSGLAWDGTTAVPRDRILWRERGRGENISADHEQDWQPYTVDPFSAISDDHTCIIPSVLSPCPLHTDSGRRKREAHINWSMMTCKGSTCYWKYFGDYWLCAGGLSAVNAIGTQLHDP